MVDFEPSQVIFFFHFSFRASSHFIFFFFFRPMSFRNDVDRYALSLWVAWSGIDLKEEIAPRDVFYEMLGDDLKVEPSLRCISEVCLFLRFCLILFVLFCFVLFCFEFFLIFYFLGCLLSFFFPPRSHRSPQRRLLPPLQRNCIFSLLSLPPPFF